MISYVDTAYIERVRSNARELLALLERDPSEPGYAFDLAEAKRKLQESVR